MLLCTVKFRTRENAESVNATEATTTRERVGMPALLHPGRGWALNLAERPETQAQIAQDATTYLQVPPACLSDQFIQTDRK